MMIEKNWRRLNPVHVKIPLNPLGDGIYLYLIIIVLKKLSHSPRGSKNYHINQKRRKIYTVRFYKDVTV
jgi:hypothetical protein